MSMLSRRQFLRTSGTVVGATVLPVTVWARRAGAAEPELIPRKLPFPPNDEFGSYEPTITPDGNTIYFARFAGGGDKRVLGTTTDLFVTHRIRQTGEWPGTAADWTKPERLPDTVNSDSIDQEPRITPDGKTLYFMSRRSGSRGGADIWVTQKQPNGAEPRVESTLKRAPDEVKLYFTERLEPAYSSLRVLNAQGVQVDRRDGRVDRSNPVLLRATLPPLAPGTYKVIWRVLSIDADVTEGGFTFRIE